MSKRPLTQAELELLREAVAKHAPELQPLVDDLVGGRIINGAEANALRIAVGRELCSTGVDAELGAVNDRGVELDDLIDRVADLSTLWDE